MKKTTIIYLILFGWTGMLSAQNDFIHIGTSAKEASAALQIDKTDKGILIPRMTTGQRTSITGPAEGLLVYDTTTDSFWFFDGSIWCNAGVPNKVFDKDNDTGIFVEISTDQDDIQMRMEGTNVFVIQENSKGQVLYKTHSVTSNENLFIGSLTGVDASPNLSCVGLGHGNLDSLTTGFNNVAVGNHNLSNLKTGFENTAIGAESLSKNLSYWNTAVGSKSNTKNTTGNLNTSVGTRVMLNNTIGGSNSVIGSQALLENISGNDNSVLGTAAMLNNTTGESNVAIGDSSMLNANSSYNVAVGGHTLQNNTSGFSQTAVGYTALISNTTGSHNTAIGESALGGVTIGSYNTAVGDDSGLGIVSGSHNVAIGNESMKKSSTQSFLVAIGDSSLHNNGTGATGAEATMNTAVGSKAMLDNTTGQANTVLGFEGLYKNTSGDFNVAIGKHTLFFNTTGDYNASVGTTAMYNNTDGIYNTAVGYQSMYENTSGFQNTAIGYDAHYSADTGDKNTALGAGALYSNDVGNNNTALGHEAGYGNVQGHDNVFIGYRAGYNEFGSDKLYIENSDSANPLIYGDFTDDTLTINGLLGLNTMPGQNVALHIKQETFDEGMRLEYSTDTDYWDTYIDSSDDYNFGYNGTLTAYIKDTDGSFNAVSDRRLKSNIADLETVIEKVNLLQPRSYYFKSDSEKTESMGFIAQELEAVFPELVSQKGDIKTVNYTALSVIAIQAIKDQQKIIDRQGQMIESILERLDQLESDEE